jgi:hypothetical protein
MQILQNFIINSNGLEKGGKFGLFAQAQEKILYDRYAVMAEFVRMATTYSYQLTFV